MLVVLAGAGAGDGDDDEVEDGDRGGDVGDAVDGGDVGGVGVEEAGDLVGRLVEGLGSEDKEGGAGVALPVAGVAQGGGAVGGVASQLIVVLVSLLGLGGGEAKKKGGEEEQSSKPRGLQLPHGFSSEKLSLLSLPFFLPARINHS